MSDNRDFCVYVHTCIAPGNSYGKVYVGQTCRKPESRWGEGKNYGHCLFFDAAIKKYGWDSFKHEIIAIGLTQDEADRTERETIEKYQSDNPDFGFNLTRGGRSLVGGENPVSRSVVLFDCVSGNRVLEFSSLKEASDYVGVDVFHCLSGEQNTSAQFIVRYADDVAGVLRLPSRECVRHRSQPMKEKPVNQYDKCGKFIATFSSIQDAEKANGLCRGCVGNVVRGKAKLGGGFQWRYYCGDISDIPPVKDRWEVRKENHNYHGRKVAQVEPKTRKVIAIHDSVRSAVKAVNGNRGSILKVLNDESKRRTASGFAWEYV